MNIFYFEKSDLLFVYRCDKFIKRSVFTFTHGLRIYRVLEII